MKRFLTQRHALFALTLFTFFAAWNREINLLYIFFALLAATLFFASLLPRFAIRDIYAERILPPTAVEDDILEIGIHVENKGRTARYMIELVDFIPAAAPESQHPMTFVAHLPAHGKRKYAFNRTCYKRGVYSVGPLRIQSGYPLGLSTVQREVSQGAASLLVYPAVFEIARFPIPCGSHTPWMGGQTLSRAGQTEEFFGVREYRSCDSLKYVHWPSTARHSQLIVKEFELRAAAAVSLLLDLDQESCIGEGKETTLEYMVKIAASLAKYALEKGNKVQLIGYGQKDYIVPFGSGFTQCAAIFETLAQVEANGKVPYAKAMTYATALLEEGGTAVLFFCKDLHTLSSLEGDSYSLAFLQARRIKILGIVFDKRSFSSHAPSYRGQEETFSEVLQGQGVHPYFVHKGDNLKEIFQG